MHLSVNVKPEGGGGGGAGICGAFDLYCLPHPHKFDYESGPQGGDICLFVQRNGTKSHRPMCSSVQQPPWKCLCGD